MATFILAAVISLLAILQRTDARLVAGTIFAGTGLAHILLFYSWQLAFHEDIDGITYFVTAAVFSVIAMELIYRIKEVTGLVITLQRVCSVEIVVNIAGLVLWYNSAYPEVNAYIFVAIRLWAISALIKKDGADDLGGCKTSTRWSYFMRVIAPWRGTAYLHNKRGGGTA